VEVLFDPTQTSYEKLLRLYFETHDFTQVGGQGPDIGEQYRSVIFYLDEAQKLMAEKHLSLLRQMGYAPATSLESASVFWAAEDYHQEYYNRNKGKPYCHIYRKIFD
jgi:methionine-S-sulfoxide reductase